MINPAKSMFAKAMFAVLVVSATAAAHADEIIVLPGSSLWTTPVSETRNGATATITGTMPRSGDGSLEMAGERTRTVMGGLYGGANLGLFDQLSSLTFDWAIAGSSVATLHPDYTPALRVTVIDGGVRSELIWEGAYNGTYGNTERDTWYTTGTDDLFYRFSGGAVTLEGGAQVNMTLQNWQDSMYFSDAAYISAFSVGVGGSAGDGYRAFADNITIDLAGEVNTYNFELTAPEEVPEPGTLALLGLGMIGAAMARRKQRVK